MIGIALILSQLAALSRAEEGCTSGWSCSATAVTDVSGLFLLQSRVTKLIDGHRDHESVRKNGTVGYGAEPLVMAPACSIDMSSNPDFYAWGYDNSVACWATNYVLVAVIGLCIGFLLKHKPDENIFRVDHTRYCLMGKYMLTAVSVGMAGTVHQGLFGRAGDVSSGVNAKIWRWVEATLMLSGIFTICAGFALTTDKDCSRRNAIVYVLVAFAGGAICWLIIDAFGTDAIGAASWIGEGIPDLILLAVLLPAAVGCCKVHGHEDPCFRTGARIAIPAILLIFAGAYVQVALDPACGNPCPAYCPLPSPQFDHNALFHVALAIGMALLAVGMDKTCRAVEKTISKLPPDPEKPGKAQDPTREPLMMPKHVCRKS